MTVLSLAMAARFFWMISSLSASSAEVASSKIRILGSMASARAMAMR